jgi:hypothetical protein
VRRLGFGGERGTIVFDAIYDEAADEIIIAGHSNFGYTSFIAQMTPTGTVTRVRHIAMDAAMRGAVTGVRIAPDGGLVITGNEKVPPENLLRHTYVARTDPARTSFVWALRRPGDFSERAEKIILSARGDIVVATPAAGPLGEDALVTRIGLDGSHNECSAWTPATLAFETVTDTTSVPIYAFAPIGTVSLDAVTPGEQSLPAGAATYCR